MKKLCVAAGTVVIFAGIVIAFYPWLKAAYFSWMQSRAMDAWQAQTVSLPAPEYTPGPGYSDQTEDTDFTEEDTDAAFDVQYVLDHMEGIITIQKINLRAPILTGATAHNLNIAICSVDNTGKMGQIGNYVLAGHKSRIKGRHFNRLLEIRAGDTVVVENRDNVYTYKVTEVFSVAPEDVWVMDQPADRKQITLITCDYRVTPIGRFIVKGELAEPY